MPKSAIITLTTAGTSTGPFNLLSDVDSYVTPFESNILRASLIAGYTTNLIPDAATIIRVKSNGACTNYIDLTYPISPTTTTTTTTTSTTTTTTTVTPTTSTTTTTTTGPSYYTLLGPVGGLSGTSGGACLNHNSARSYYSNVNFMQSGVTYIYDSTSPTLVPLDTGGQWKPLVFVATSTVYAVITDSNGLVSNYTSC
jgi:hypothetical protein